MLPESGSLNWAMAISEYGAIVLDGSSLNASATRYDENFLRDMKVFTFAMRSAARDAATQGYRI
jgi:hypothetical protein